MGRLVYWQVVIYALELKSFKRSMLTLTPGMPFYKDIWSNQILFWAVAGGMVSVVIPIYVPGLNSPALYMTGIGKEWGVVVADLGIFVEVGCAVRLHQLFSVVCFVECLVRPMAWYKRLENTDFVEGRPYVTE